MIVKKWRKSIAAYPETHERNCRQNSYLWYRFYRQDQRNYQRIYSRSLWFSMEKWFFLLPGIFISEKVSTDYWMWLDADDMITQENLYRLKQLKETLSPNTDMVMMDYVTDFDEWNHAAFSCYRERILKNFPKFQMAGKSSWIHHSHREHPLFSHTDWTSQNKTLLFLSKSAHLSTDDRRRRASGTQRLILLWPGTFLS